MLESIAQVEALIAREVARGVPAERMLLAGFSQGGAITLAAGLRRQTPLAGADRAVDLPADGGAAGARAAQRRERAAGVHGPRPARPGGAVRRPAQRQRRTPARLGFQVDWHAYPMAHQVCAEEIGALGDWMSRRFAAG